jgi:hypothetical protein
VSPADTIMLGGTDVKVNGSSLSPEQAARLLEASTSTCACRTAAPFSSRTLRST